MPPRGLLALALLLGSAPGAAAAAECPDAARALGVERIVEIDASTGALFGDMSKQDKEPSFLGPKEVVLTFDDGPVPWITKSILDTLDQYCTKATFFSVGQMALAYPASVKEVLARGHTLGGHTWSHPLNLRQLSLEKAKDQIERGFAAVALAAGQPTAPFFRFPGLSDSGPLLQHLQGRGIAAFTVDVVSNDSYIRSAARLAQYTLRQLEARQGGIMLFHDIKAATAKALPDILAELKARGYKVVHMHPAATLTTLAEYDAELTPALAKTTNAAADGKPALVPFYGAVGPVGADGTTTPPVSQLVPAAKVRVAATSSDAETPTVSPEAAPVTKRKRRPARNHVGLSGKGKRQPKSQSFLD